MTQSSPVIDYFRSEISLGRLSPGQKLPAEPRLCEQLGVSRGVLREALRELQGYGLIEVKHGSGTYVSSLQPSELLKGLAFTVDVVPLDGLIELLEIRKALEAQAAAQAATLADEELVFRLRGLLAEMEVPASADREHKQDLDEEFHALICDAAGNKSAATIAQVIRSRSRHYNMIANADAALESLIGHRAIVRAIVEHDALGAMSAMHSHVDSTSLWLRTIKPEPN